MKNELEMVAEFHRAFGHPVLSEPLMPRKARRNLRVWLLEEEFNEHRAAMQEGNFIESVDGIVDCLYILFGTAHEMGIAHLLPDLFAEVHRSNMSKLDANGKVIYNEVGKVMKGPNYSRPDLASIIGPLNNDI